MLRSSAAPLVAFRQELPFRSLWPVARLLAGRAPGVAFLDSGGPAPAHGPDESRWSVLGWRPHRTLRWPAGRPGAIEAIRRFVGPPRMEPDPEALVPWRGGFLGWIGYDVGRHVERLPDRHGADPAVPDLVLAEYEALLVEDRRARRLFLVGACDRHEGPSRLLARQHEALEAFAAADAQDDAPAAPPATVPRPDVPRETFVARVRRVLEYIAAGDVFQVNLAHRFTSSLHGGAVDLYARLRAESPAPYGCLLDLGGPRVLSVSPELFLARRGTRLVTRPIKGTRPRSADPVEDARLARELEASAKERAELAMIVDLLRNDLGRVARTGSVRVEEPRVLAAHPTVHHAVATVTAEAGPEVHFADLVAAAMPGGSVTGAPKIRAMEILEELEDGRRGPYCGGAGFIGHDGDLTWNVLIRTVVVQGSAASFHVGGGIVADSDPEAEYEETLVKARALVRALSGTPA